MNPRNRFFRIGVTTLFLTMPPLGAASTGLGSLQDDPPPAREAIDAGLAKRRKALLELEEWVQARRDEIKLQLTDFVASQQVVVAKAQKELGEAKIAHGQAVYALKEYERGIYLQDRATALGKVVLAKADLERAIDSRKDLDRMREKGLQADPIKMTRAELDFQQAGFDLEEAQGELLILTKYTKDKETKKRQSTLDIAKAVEAEKEGLLQLEQAKAAKLVEQAERFKVRAPEDLVLALLDGAIQDEGKVSDLIVEAQKIEAQVREKPGEASGLAEKMRAKKSEADALMKHAKAQLLDAATLGERVRSLRVELRNAEARLKKARELVEILEREFAPKREAELKSDKPPGSRP